ncbi:ABC transporter substrate-binding protein [Pseudochelatococcus sp. B33]
MTGHLYIAPDKDYFAEQNLNVEVRFFEAAQAIATAVIACGITFGVTSLTASLYSLVDKGGLRAITGGSKKRPYRECVHRFEYVIVVPHGGAGAVASGAYPM